MCTTTHPFKFKPGGTNEECNYEVFSVLLLKICIDPPLWTLMHERTSLHSNNKERTATPRWWCVEIRGYCFPSKFQQYSELFCLFLDLHEKVGTEHGQDSALTCFSFCWVILIICSFPALSTTSKVGMFSP